MSDDKPNNTAPKTPRALAAWDAYITSAPASGYVEARALRVAQHNAWFDGRACGLVEGAMSVARVDGEAYARGVEAGRREERRRISELIQSRGDAFVGTAAWTELILEIEGGDLIEESQP
jgi:hypothetical protein